MKIILLSLFFSLAVNFGFSQCAATAGTNSQGNATCITLNWPAGRTTPYPVSITIGVNTYNLQTGLSVNPSIYKNGKLIVLMELLLHIQVL